MSKIAFLCYFKVKVGVKVKGHGQGHIWCTVVNIKGSAKSNPHHYQSKVIVCVSVISGHMWIIMRRQSISF